MVKYSLNMKENLHTKMLEMPPIETFQKIYPFWWRQISLRFQIFQCWRFQGIFRTGFEIICGLRQQRKVFMGEQRGGVGGETLVMVLHFCPNYKLQVQWTLFMPFENVPTLGITKAQAERYKQTRQVTHYTVSTDRYLYS